MAEIHEAAERHYPTPFISRPVEQHNPQPNAEDDSGTYAKAVRALARAGRTYWTS